MGEEWNLPKALDLELQGENWTIESVVQRVSALTGEEKCFIEPTVKALHAQGIKSDDDHMGRLVMALRSRVIPVKLRPLRDVATDKHDTDGPIARLIWALLRFHAPMQTTTLQQLTFLELSPLLGCLGTSLVSGISLERQCLAVRGQPAVLPMGLVHVVQALTVPCLNAEEANKALGALLAEADRDVSMLFAVTPNEFKIRWRSLLGYHPEPIEDHGGVVNQILCLTPFSVCDKIAIQAENTDIAKITLIDCRTYEDIAEERSLLQHVDDWAKEPKKRYVRAAGGRLHQAIHANLEDEDTFLLRLEVTRGALIILFGSDTQCENVKRIAGLIISYGFPYVVCCDGGYRGIIESFTEIQALEHIKLLPIKEEWHQTMRKTMLKSVAGINDPNTLNEGWKNFQNKFSEIQKQSNINSSKIETGVAKWMEQAQSKINEVTKELDPKNRRSDTADTFDNLPSGDQRSETGSNNPQSGLNGLADLFKSKKSGDKLNQDETASNSAGINADELKANVQAQTAKIQSTLSEGWIKTLKGVDKLTKKADETLRQTSVVVANDTVKSLDEEDKADDVFAIDSDDEGSLEAKTPKNKEDTSPFSSTRPVNVASTFAVAVKGDHFARQDVIRSPLILKFFVKKIREKRSSTSGNAWFAKALTLVPVAPVSRLAVLCLNQLLMLEDAGEEFIVKSNRRIQSIKSISYDPDKPNVVEFFYRDKEKTNKYSLEDNEKFIKALQERLLALNIGMRTSQGDTPVPSKPTVEAPQKSSEDLSPIG